MPIVTDTYRAHDWQLICIMTGANALHLGAPRLVWPWWWS